MHPVIRGQRVGGESLTAHGIEISYDTGAGNSLEIRGTGPGMTWNTGRRLIWQPGNRWVLEDSAGARPFDYKVVLKKPGGVCIWEEGPNRRFDPNGQSSTTTPVFAGSPSVSAPASHAPAFAIPALPAPLARTIELTCQIADRQLEIRGSGPGMAWDRSRTFTQQLGSRWTFTIAPGTGPFDYKVGFMRNGEFVWEEGANRHFDPNSSDTVRAPVFPAEQHLPAPQAAMPVPRELDDTSLEDYMRRPRTMRFAAHAAQPAQDADAIRQEAMRTVRLPLRAAQPAPATDEPSALLSRLLAPVTRERATSLLGEAPPTLSSLLQLPPGASLGAPRRGAFQTMLMPISPVAAPAPAAVAAGNISTAATLIGNYDRCWNPTTKVYENVPFSIAEFERVAQANSAALPLAYNPQTEFGVVEKRIVAPGTKIFVRADLHGDLKSVLENLKALQAEGLLDASFKCTSNAQLVFLGDYSDRGNHSMEVLQLLMTLRMENPGKVTLIRGNHESPMINMSYCGASDAHFREFLYEANGYTPKVANGDMLERIYQTMPLSVFIGEQSTSGRTQYTMFTHGTFEFYADPFEMLSSPDRAGSMPIPKIPGVGVDASSLISGRVRALAATPARNYAAELERTANPQTRKQIKQEWAAHRVNELARRPRDAEDVASGITVFNWGDMSVGTSEDSSLGSLGYRAWKVSPADVKHYLRSISSPTGHKVVLVFRGHEHFKQHHLYQGKIVVTTLPVGMDSAYGSRFPGQLDTGYIITTAATVSDWTKQIMLREPGTTGMRIEDPRLLRDDGDVAPNAGADRPGQCAQQ